MIYAYSLYGGQQLKRAIPLENAGTLIPSGAAIMRGSTAATDQGYGIIAASTINNFMGVTEAAFTVANDNDPPTGLIYNLTDLTINPDAVYQAEFSQATGLTVASVSTGYPTVTSLEAIDGGWVLGVTGPGAGYLGFVKSVSAGAATLKSTNSGFTTASKIIKINPLYCTKLDLTTNATQIKGTTAALGSGLIRLLENYVKAPGFNFQALDPTKHDAITFATGFKFFGMVMFETSIYNSAN